MIAISDELRNWLIAEGMTSEAGGTAFDGLTAEDREICRQLMGMDASARKRMREEDQTLPNARCADGQGGIRPFRPLAAQEREVTARADLKLVWSQEAAFSGTVRRNAVRLKVASSR